MKDATLLRYSLVASAIIHLFALFLASTMMSNKGEFAKNFVPISLVDLPQEPDPVALPKEKTPAPIKKLEPLIAEKKVSKETLETVTREASLSEKSALPASPEPGTAKVEGGGSEAGAGNLFGRGDVGIIPGSGMAGGGSGTAAAGLGQGSGAPGLPAKSTVLRTSREAKPIQSARPNYPAVALRLGLEGDVSLKIEVDPEGKVTKAEILKSAWAGFDEEALRAVKQSRFEPAQRDGQNIPAEFTYIYRFRLAR